MCHKKVMKLDSTIISKIISIKWQNGMATEQPHSVYCKMKHGQHWNRFAYLKNPVRKSRFAIAVRSLRSSHKGMDRSPLPSFAKVWCKSKVKHEHWTLWLLGVAEFRVSVDKIPGLGGDKGVWFLTLFMSVYSCLVRVFNSHFTILFTYIEIGGDPSTCITQQFFLRVFLQTLLLCS